MIVIFGGAFNPIHNEHVRMIKHLLTRKEVDKVVVLPSNNPPHKECGLSFEHRSNMINLALRGLNNVEICDYESLGEQKHYTCEVLPQLKKKYGNIAFVIGGDSLEAFHTWKNPDEIIKICPLYVFTRGKSKRFYNALNYWTSQGADIKVCEYEPKNISSTLVRYNAMLGIYKDIDNAVADYIRKNNLYNDYANIVERLKCDIPQKTFEHCLRTASYALRLNYVQNLGLDYSKVLLAGLLHDCAKNKTSKGMNYTEVPPDSIGTAVEHQFLGSVIARENYNILDNEILDAIRYHTTGKYEMTKLEKLIFCSDMLEDARDFEGVSTLRRSIIKSLDKGYSKCVVRQYEYLKSKGAYIYPLTVDAVKGLDKNLDLI